MSIKLINSKLIQYGRVFCAALVLLFAVDATAQGKLLIVGGGSEKPGANSWSTPAYRWAVEGKRAAIIGTTTGSLASYMKNSCGAAFAREFAINTRDSADSQVTYDTLVTYDVIFFRGGDQYDYYRLYRATKLLEAVNYIYSTGGCIGGTSAGMHILSGVIFTAKNGTVYPEECIENPSNYYVTLADDFLDLVPGYIFDTHFAERGRFGRLTAFLANWYFQHDQSITGIGMDDMTCMTIDENGLATVYGTGCANIYRINGGFSQNGNKLLADSIKISQLLQGCTYHFGSGAMTMEGLDFEINTNGLQETGNFTILATGNDLLVNNQSMLADLVNQTGSSSDEILLLSGDEAAAMNFKNAMLNLGAPAVHIFNPGVPLGNDPDLANYIALCSKFCFLKNSAAGLIQFLQTPNGELLSQKLRENGTASAFAGADARFAGNTVVEGYLVPGASYYAELVFLRGISLLKHTVIMPDTYLDNVIFENTATAVPYAMALDTLKYGIWLTGKNYMKYYPEGEKRWLSGYGAAPVMVVRNDGLMAGFSRQTSTGNTGVSPRMVGGFETLWLDLVDASDPYLLGEASAQGIPGPGRDPSDLKIFPNPASDKLYMVIPEGGKFYSIHGADGRELRNGRLTGKATGVIELNGLAPGFYVVRLCDSGFASMGNARFIKY